MIKDAYIAIKTSDQNVEIGTNRLQKYSRFRVSSEREQFAPCVETAAGKQLPFCEEIPRSLFWARNKLNELPEECFEFSFALIGKSTMAFLTGQSWSVLKSWYTGGDPQQGFGAVLQINLLR